MNRFFISLFALVALCTALLTGCQQVPGEIERHPVISFSVTEVPVHSAAVPSPSVFQDPLQERLDGMTLQQKVGQLFFARFPQDNDALEEIETFQPAGYILFGVNFENSNPETLKATLKKCQSVSEIPLLFGVDEEGGTVVRASKYSTFRSEPFASPQKLYQQGGLQRIAEDAEEKSRFLKELGFTVNLAPVSDVSTDPQDFIYARSFGQPAEQTAEYVSTVVKAMQQTGVSPVLKHFPGYGNNVDTHTGSAVDDRSYEQFLVSDFLPFQAGIEAGAPAILISHNIVHCMDEQYPASLSKKAHDVLREDLGFEGIIMTDDLAMDAVSSYSGSKSSAVLAVLAGNDLLISSDLPSQYRSVLEAVEQGEISQQMLDRAVLRVLRWKESLGLL